MQGGPINLAFKKKFLPKNCTVFGAETVNFKTSSIYSIT